MKDTDGREEDEEERYKGGRWVKDAGREEGVSQE